MRTAVVVALAALLSGCAVSDGGGNAPTVPQGRWRLVTLDGAAADATVRSTLTMDDGRSRLAVLEPAGEG